jgi:hypothetical protein
MNYKIKIYVLCSNEKKLEDAKLLYKGLKWAFPILMKYQDCTMENAFWKQLEEIEEDWKDFDYIGSISSSAINKINISHFEKIMNDEDNYKNEFLGFNKDNILLKDDIRHPNLQKIFNEILLHDNNIFDINLEAPVYLYNYWIASKTKLKKFFPWVQKLICFIKSLPDELIKANAYYNPQDKKNYLGEEKCLEIFNKPYYTYEPFVLERLTSQFFMPKILIYTVNLGNYNEHFPHVKQNYPFVSYKIFSNNEEDLFMDGRINFEKSRKYRMASHLLNFKEKYDFAIYLDANVKIKDENFINKILKLHDEYKFDFAMSLHNERKFGMEELNTCLKYCPKYHPVGLERFKKIILEEKDGQLCWCGFNVQWLQSPNYSILTNLFDDWWKTLKIDPLGVSNDQIIFPCILNRYKELKMHYFKTEYLQNNFFFINANNFGKEYLNSLYN